MITFCFKPIAVVIFSCSKTICCFLCIANSNGKSFRTQRIISLKGINCIFIFIQYRRLRITHIIYNTNNTCFYSFIQLSQIIIFINSRTIFAKEIPYLKRRIIINLFFHTDISFIIRCPPVYSRRINLQVLSTFRLTQINRILIFLRSIQSGSQTSSIDFISYLDHQLDRFCRIAGSHRRQNNRRSSAQYGIHFHIALCAARCNFTGSGIESSINNHSLQCIGDRSFRFSCGRIAIRYIQTYFTHLMLEHECNFRIVPRSRTRSIHKIYRIMTCILTTFINNFKLQFSSRRTFIACIRIISRIRHFLIT